MKQGLVIGKFYPPHNGHHYLIDFASARVKQLDVLVCDDPKFSITAGVRASWLKQIHPNVRVHIIPDIGLDDDSRAWAKHTIQFLGYAPDIVFSSEDYGKPYAEFMGARHYMVDRQRSHIPVAATYVRQDVLRHWHYLHPLVRENYALRICVVGAESTGTTTLAKALAQNYQTYWVAEFGRQFSESSLWANHIWQSADFRFIAAQQQRIENYFAGLSNKLLVCDTNAFATRLWHERYMGEKSRQVDNIAAKDKVSLYIITDINIPFEDDGVRDGEHVRHMMHRQFIAEVMDSGIPYIITKGSPKKRLQSARKVIDTLIKNGVTI